MNRLTLFWVMLIVTIVFASIVTAFNTYQHENVHKAAAVHNGCIDYSIDYNVFKPSTFQCHNRTNNNYDETEYMIDSVNEVVGYNVSSIILALFSCTILIVTTIIFKK